MRNKHTFQIKAEIRCPFESCGKTFGKTITVEYETNQRGDVISHSAKEKTR